jgi:hypothetical protein
MNSVFALASARLGWHNKGFSDGRYHAVRNLPNNPEAREAYLTGWRTGNRERLRAEAEERP